MILRRVCPKHFLKELLKFKIVTDCAAFRQTIEKKDIPCKTQRWVMQIQEYELDIEHRAGKRMTHVDTLSRAPVINMVEDETLSRIRKAQQTDDYIKSIKEILKERTEFNEFIVK